MDDGENVTITTNCCMICLKDEQETAGKLRCDDILQNIYNSLVWEEIHQLGIISLWFCVNCAVNLENINDFKQQCLNSINHLKDQMDFNTVFVKEEDINNYETREIKEENVEYEELPKVEKHKKSAKAEKEGPNAYCSICKEFFKHNIVKHIVSVHSTTINTGEVLCIECNELSKDEKGFLYHFKRHRDYFNPRPCKVCGDLFMNQKEHERHVQDHWLKQNRIFNCTDCPAKFPTKTKLMEHISQEHRVEISLVNVSKDLELFIDEDKYEHSSNEKEIKNANTHKNRGKNLETGYCSICKEFFQKKIFYHISNIHSTVLSPGQVKCLVCNELYKDQKTFQYHFRRHRDYLHPKPCKFCGEMLINQKKHERHVQDHYIRKSKISEDIFLCNECGATFKSKFRLREHDLKQHQGAHKCKYCFRPFLDKEKFEQHMKEEEDKKSKKPFYICDHCGYKKKMRIDMWKHMRRHHMKNPLNVCKECKRTFNTRVQLRHHEVITHLPKRFECHECGMKFAISGYLKKHMHSHTKTRPFNCNLCPTGYYNNEYLRRHFEKVHGITYTGADIRRICGKQECEFLEALARRKSNKNS